MEMIRENFKVYYLLDERKFNVISRQQSMPILVVLMGAVCYGFNYFGISAKECELAHYSEQLKWYYTNSYRDCRPIANRAANRVACLHAKNRI